MPPVGKSGPPITSISSSVVGRGRRLVITSSMARAAWARLWGAMLVAIPTAMPAVPLTSRLGRAAGSTAGSVPSPS